MVDSIVEVGNNTFTFEVQEEESVSDLILSTWYIEERDPMPGRPLVA